MARPRVAVCVDLDDDVEIIRAIHRQFVLAHGRLVVTAAPQAGTVDHLIRAMLIGLNVLWRLSTHLQCARVSLVGEERAAAEWEISWALTRTGITDLWVLDAHAANAFAWRWLRDTAEREDLRLVLHTTTVPDTAQGAVLTGCRVRTLSPERLRGPGRPSNRRRDLPSSSWPETSEGIDRPFRG